MKKSKLTILGYCLLVSAIVYSTATSLSRATDQHKNHEHYFSESARTEEALTVNAADNSSLGSSSQFKSYKRGMPLDTDPESITIFVNKEYSLPQDYVPKDLIEPAVAFSFPYYNEKRLLRVEAAHALENLFAAASLEGHSLTGVSGYRSYKRQNEIYTTNLRKKGIAFTELYSAKPGYSEHQTGLAIDISSESFDNRLAEGFGDTPDGKWVNDHAHEYGFIIRYPKDKESITGYSYEPWHIRYVGVGLATYLYENNLTFEEYFDYTPPVFEKPSYESSDEMDHSTHSENEEYTQTDTTNQDVIDSEGDLEQPDSEQSAPETPDIESPESNNGDTVNNTNKKPAPDQSDTEVEQQAPGTDTQKPNNSKPDNTKPDNTKPDNTKPDNAKPDNAKPDNAKPDNAKPDNTKPNESKPGTEQNPSTSVPEHEHKPNDSTTKPEDKPSKEENTPSVDQNDIESDHTEPSTSEDSNSSSTSNISDSAKNE